MPSYEPLVEGLPTRPAPFIDALFANFGASELQGTAGHCRAVGLAAKELIKQMLSRDRPLMIPASLF